ncbi:MAG: hypothetical protein K2X57_00695 [Xanthobacteraceae bacterium]|nr:hypothetical protein [Xanthobacteraceae bacterium]
MSEKKRHEIFLPAFGGFYNTKWEQLLYDSEEQYAQIFAAREADDGGLDSDDFVQILDSVTDTHRHCISLARSFCKYFDKRMSDSLGFQLGLQFSELDSPDEYNFRTDRILATMPTSSVRKLFKLSAKVLHGGLDEAIEDRFTPYPGFMPYYSNDIVARLAKPVEEWDYHELCTLLDAHIDSEIDDLVFGDVVGGGDAELAYEAATDWKRFEKIVARQREKLKTLEDSDGEVV